MRVFSSFQKYTSNFFKHFLRAKNLNCFGVSKKQPVFFSEHILFFQGRFIYVPVVVAGVAAAAVVVVG